MMNTKKKLILFLSILGFVLFSGISTYAQNYQDTKRGFFNNWRIVVDGGLNLFYGDIQQYSLAPFKEDYRIAYSLTFRKQLSPVFSLGGQLLNGNLHGTKRKIIAESNPIQYEGVNFDSKVFEYNLNSTINFSNLISGYDAYRKFSIYGIAGIGFSNWETELKDYQTGEVLRRSGFTGSGPNKRTTEIVVPVGLGFKFRLSNSLDLNLQSTMRGVNSDNLDATVSNRKYDYYGYTSLGLSYNFNSVNFSISNPERKEARYQRRIEKEARRDMNAYSKQEALKKRKNIRRELEEEKRQRSEEINRLRSKKVKYNDQAPKAAEYDIINITSYSMEDIKGTNYTIGTAKIKEEAPKQEEIIIDEGKFIITGNQNAASSTNNYNTNNSGKIIKKISPQNKQNIISSKGEIKQQSNLPQAGIFYRVQILAKYNKRANIKQIVNTYNISESIVEEYINSYYKYTAGMFYNYNDAVNYQRVLKNKGIIGAFIIGYQNGKRVSLKNLL